MNPVRDKFARPLRSLRLSVTDRCNLRCGYCMPEDSYTWLPRKDLLTLEEHATLVEALMPMGVSRVRLTGGEPLLRRNLAALVERLASLGLDDLSLTTNAVRLAEFAGDLKAAGLGRITVSLDTLRPARFKELTRRDDLDATMRGIEAAADAGFTGTKLNAVVMRGKNDDEILDLLAFGYEHGIEVRFIEYMDVGGATRWTMDDVMSAGEIIKIVGAAHGATIEPVDLDRTDAPADRFRLPTGQIFGIIASTTRPFCAGCDRARITADGSFISCLYSLGGEPLLPTLREAGPEAAAEAVARLWRARSDRGAEERSVAANRVALVQPDELKDRPHLEMHTRGG